jgi:hypothetical protein
MQTPPKSADRIGRCVARAAELRQRAESEADPVAKAELQRLAMQWIDIAESYRLVADGHHFIEGVRARRSAVAHELVKAAQRGRPGSAHLNGGASLADLLAVLVSTAVEHTEGEGRAAFWLSDATAGRLCITSSG